jgi:hypothetical protein
MSRRGLQPETKPGGVGWQGFFTRRYWTAFWIQRRWDIVFGLILGFAIHFLISYVPPFPSLANWIEEKSIDWVMSRSQERADSKNPVPAFLFLDIDEQTFEAWDEPLFTPRDRMLRLICYGIENGAAAIVVDVSLDKRRVPQWDQNLADLLSSFGKTGDGSLPNERGCKSLTPGIAPGRTKIFLTRGVRPSKAEGNCMESVSSFLDEETGLKCSVLGQSGSPNVMWTTVLFVAGEDNTIRWWRLWEPVCQKDSSVLFLPSVEVAVVNWLHEREEGKTVGGIIPRKEEMPLDIGAANGQSRLSQRMVFTAEWAPDKPQAQSSVPEWTSMPAWKVAATPEELSKNHAKPPPGDRALDRVVVIGSSAREFCDLHLTPRGEMPGGMVLINAIASRWRNRALQPLPSWLEHSLSLLLLSFLIILFMSLRPFVAYLVALLTVLISALAIGTWGFERGYWAGIALPLVTVVLHHSVEQCKEVLEHYGILKRDSRHPVHGDTP